MSNNNSTSGSGQSRKTRTNLEKRDADILCQILKTLDDGTWKRRFPILKAMRTELQLSQKIIVATGILFNISRMWKDEGPEDDGDSEDGSENEDEESGNRSSSQASVTIEEGDPGSVRVRGQVERERLKDNMP